MTKTGKVIARVTLGLATVGLSEVGIHSAKMKEFCGEERWVPEMCGNPYAQTETNAVGAAAFS